MSLLQNSNAISSGGYGINNSLRFRASASAYLNRTPPTAGLNQTKTTLSVWIKRGLLGTGPFVIYGARNGVGTTYTLFYFSVDTLTFLDNQGANLSTTAVFRDPSAWYHIVLSYDTSQATASDRVSIYVNGVKQILSGTYPTLNAVLAINYYLMPQQIGQQALNQFFDGYMAEFHNIDGQTLTPSSFGETDTDTGSWKPKPYSGSYGTNGFSLKFSDIAITSGSNAGLGKDFSGNGNYFNTNNISVTAGVTYDAMIDSPTLTSETVANYATFSGSNLGTFANATITEAGLRVSVSAGGTPDGGKAYAPFGMSPSSGKWYFEMTCVDPGASNQRLCFGVANVTTNPNAVAIANGYYASASGAHGNFNIGTFTTGDILQVAYDSATYKLWFGKNNTWYNSGDPVAGTNPTATVTSGITYVPFSTYASSGGGPGIGAWNFGQRPLSYTPPSGYLRLNTYNLPDRTIKKGSSYMDTKLYTGTNANQSITSFGFSPDLIWIKNRNDVESHHLVDSVRGNNKFLISNSNVAERTGSLNNGYNQVNLSSNGFDIVSNGLNDELNLTGRTYVSWGWDGGSSTVTNTSGTISSQVRANTTAGFSVVTYTGSGANATVGHGLGVAPKMIVIKMRNAISEWTVFHTSIANTQYLFLNSTAAVGTAAAMWNSTSPTSTVFSLGTNGNVNNPNTFVAYCWAEIAGFSKFGSWTGNGSTDGPFVYTGFRPKFIMFKEINTSSFDWIIYDSSRSAFNAVTLRLNPNNSNADFDVTTNYPFDFVSNGFKIRGTNGTANSNGNPYIYMAFAENPFKNANAR
jgi:hypothetical protein